MPPSLRGRGAEVSYDEDLDTGLARYDAALDEAHDRVSSMGVLVERPRPFYGTTTTYYDGRLPSDYASYGMAELSELLRVTTEWADYTGHLVKMATNEKIAAEEKLSLVKAHLRKTKSGAKTDKDDDVLRDVRYIEANAHFVTARTVYELFDAADAAARRDNTAVSRCITALQAQLERSGRVGSVDGALDARARERSSAGPRRSGFRSR